MALTVISHQLTVGRDIKKHIVMRRISTILVVAFALALMSAGCAATGEGNGAATGKTILNASTVEVESRAGWNPVDGGHWHPGDMVAVIDVASGIHTPFSIDGAEGNITFTGDVEYADGTPVIGLYPHTTNAGYIDEEGGQTILSTVPAVQTYVPDGVRDLPMAGRAVAADDRIDMAFHHLYALVRIPVTVAATEDAETLTVKSVTLETPDGKDVWAQLRADMTDVDAATAPIVWRDASTDEGGEHSAQGGNSITLNCVDTGVVIDKHTPVYFHIAVMPTVDGQDNSYADGLKLSFELEGSDDKAVRTNATSYNFDTCGRIYTLKEVAVSAPAPIVESKIRLDAESLQLTTQQRSKTSIFIGGVDFRFMNVARTSATPSNIITSPAGGNSYIRNNVATPGDITKIVYSLASKHQPIILIGFDSTAAVTYPSTSAPSTVDIHEIIAPAGTRFFSVQTPNGKTELEYIDVYYKE